MWSSEGREIDQRVVVIQHNTRVGPSVNIPRDSLQWKLQRNLLVWQQQQWRVVGGWWLYCATTMFYWWWWGRIETKNSTEFLILSLPLPLFTSVHLGNSGGLKIKLIVDLIWFLWCKGFPYFLNSLPVTVVHGPVQPGCISHPRWQQIWWYMRH